MGPVTSHYTRPRGSGGSMCRGSIAFPRAAVEESLLCPAPRVAPALTTAVDAGEQHEVLLGGSRDPHRIGKDAFLPKRGIEPRGSELAPTRAAVGGEEELERYIWRAVQPAPPGTERDLSLSVAFGDHRVDQRVPELLCRRVGMKDLVVAGDAGQRPARVEASEKAQRIEQHEKCLGRHGAGNALYLLRRLPGGCGASASATSAAAALTAGSSAGASTAAVRSRRHPRGPPPPRVRRAASVAPG